MSNGPNFICIIGTDGSGKTTQCKRLCSEFRSRDESVQYSWCKFESKFLYYLVEGLKRLFTSRGEDMSDYENRKEKKDSILSNRVARVPYLTYILIHYYYQVLREVVWPLASGTTVVCDRYVYDTVVDIAVDLDYSISSSQTILDLYLKLIPKPDVLIYLKTPPEVSMERKGDIPNLEFVEEKKEVYDALLASSNATTISGVGGVDEIADKIDDQVFDRCH